jgi:hypothetical protein
MALDRLGKNRGKTKLRNNDYPNLLRHSANGRPHAANIDKVLIRACDAAFRGRPGGSWQRAHLLIRSVPPARLERAT